MEKEARGLSSKGWKLEITEGERNHLLKKGLSSGA